MNLRIQSLIAALCLLVLFATAPVSAPLSDVSIVRWEYVSSVETPDGLAFVDWLQYFSEELKRSRADAAKFLVFKFELPDNAASFASVESVIDILQQASYTANSDTLSSDIEAYCPGGTEVRSNDQIFEVMDAQDDAYVHIAERNYANVVEQLDSATREKLQATVAKHKRSFHAISYSHKEAWESKNANPDMRSIVSGICSELIAKRNRQDY